MNLNGTKGKQPNVELGAPKIDDIPLELSQQEVPTIKSEIVSTEDGNKSANINSIEPKVISHQTLEFGQECHVKSDEDISIKNEVLHEEFGVKSEDETISLDDKDNLQTQLVKGTRISSRLKDFKCNICDSHFTRKDHFKTHLMTHTGEKPFICNACDYSCSLNTSLKVHLRTHTAEKPFKCNICHYSCTQNSSLKKHQRTHSGDKPYRCNICDSNYTQRSDLKDHLRSHTGEKPFKCNICDTSFGHRKTLKNHLRTHMGEKPFQCNICNYICSRKYILQNHLAIHSRSNPA